VPNDWLLFICQTKRLPIKKNRKYENIKERLTQEIQLKRTLNMNLLVILLPP
jgi:hypothetical protein